MPFLVGKFRCFEKVCFSDRGNMAGAGTADLLLNGGLLAGRKGTAVSQRCSTQKSTARDPELFKILSPLIQFHRLDHAFRLTYHQSRLMSHSRFQKHFSGITLCLDGKGRERIKEKASVQSRPGGTGTTSMESSLGATSLSRVFGCWHQQSVDGIFSFGCEGGGGEGAVHRMQVSCQRGGDFITKSSRLSFANKAKNQ